MKKRIFLILLAMFEAFNLSGCASEKNTDKELTEDTDDEDEYDNDYPKIRHFTDEEIDSVTTYTEDELKAASNTDWFYYVYDGNIDVMGGPYGGITVKDERDALLSIYCVSSIIGCKDPQREFALKRTNSCDGRVNYQFDQVQKGIEVYCGHAYISVDSEGNVDSMDIEYICDLPKYDYVISEEEAEDIAKQYLGYDYETELDRRIIYPTDGGDYHPSYAINCGDSGVFVDGITGEVMSSWSYVVD